MKKFISTRLVDAMLMTRGSYNLMRGWELPEDENPDDIGYLVHKDDRLTWVPVEVFEEESFMLAADNNTITQKDVDAFIKRINVTEIAPNESGTIVTTVTATLANGFTVTESSTCVDPANYDVDTGIMCCMERIEDKVWFLLGFLLSSAVSGFHRFDAESEEG